MGPCFLMLFPFCLFSGFCILPPEGLPWPSVTDAPDILFQGKALRNIQKTPSRNRTKLCAFVSPPVTSYVSVRTPLLLCRAARGRMTPAYDLVRKSPLGNDTLSHNGGTPCRTTRPGTRPAFCPACSEAIFTVPLLAPVSHPHRLAGAFPEQLLSSSWHLLSVTFF